MGPIKNKWCENSVLIFFIYIIIDIEITIIKKHIFLFNINYNYSFNQIYILLNQPQLKIYFLKLFFFKL
jgi:hypothetical protein